MFLADEVTTKIITGSFVKEILLGVLAIIVPYLTYRLGIKKISGKISSSEATDLWRENEAVKKGYLVEIQEHKQTVDLLRGDINTLKLDSIRIREEALKIRMRLGWYRVLRKEYVAEIDLLQEELIVLQDHIKNGELNDTNDRLDAAQRVYIRLEYLKKRILATDNFDTPEEIKPSSGENKIQS